MSCIRGEDSNFCGLVKQLFQYAAVDFKLLPMAARILFRLAVLSVKIFVLLSKSLNTYSFCIFQEFVSPIGHLAP